VLTLSPHRGQVECPEGWQGLPDARWKRVLIGGNNGHRSWHWHYPKDAKKLVLARPRPAQPPQMHLQSPQPVCAPRR